jgi:hypothetical protein
MSQADTSMPLATLDYHADDPSPRLPLLDARTLAHSAIAATIVTVGVFVLIPRMEPVFYTFGWKFPALTAKPYQFGERWGGLGAALIWLAAAVPPAASMPLGRKGRLILRHATFLLLGLAVAWAIVGICEPYVRLMLTVERGASSDARLFLEP